MNPQRFWRWLTLLAAVVLGVAILIGIGLAAAWQHLPNANISIDGESFTLPALQGWPAAVALVVGVVAVMLAAMLVVGVFAISLVATVLCAALVVMALMLAVLLILSPLLLIVWGVWRLSRPAPARIAA